MATKSKQAISLKLEAKEHQRLKSITISRANERNTVLSRSLAFVRSLAATEMMITVNIIALHLNDRS